jgi:hypothetical protein
MKILGKKIDATLAIACAAAFLLALVYTAFVASYFSNYPKGDDFLAIFPPAVAAAERGMSAVTVAEVFAQHFSHRIAPVRILAMAQVLGTGHLNFIEFSWVGLLSWIAAFTILAARAGWSRSAAALICAALVWFQPGAASNCLVPMQAASNLPIIVLAFAAFGLRASNWRGSWGLAWVTGLLGLATTGNGFVVLGTLLAWDAIQRNWRAVALGSGLSCIAALLYFTAFENPGSQKYTSSLADIAGNVLVMMGAVFKLGPVPLWVPMAGGALLVVWSAAVLIVAALRGEFFTAATLAFVGGSVAMASLARAGWGNEYMLQPRYMVYPIISLAVCVAFTVASFRRASFSVLAIVACCAFYIAMWWQGAPDVVTSHRVATAEALSWAMGYPSHRFSGDAASNAVGAEDAAAQLRRANELGIFTPERSGLLGAGFVLDPFRCEVEAKWSIAGAGYILSQSPSELESHETVLVTFPNWKQVALRPQTRFALGRFLRGEPQMNAPLILAAPPFEVPATLKVVAQPLILEE